MSSQGEPVAAVIPAEVLANAMAAEAANGSDSVVIGATGIRANFVLSSPGDTLDAVPGDGACADSNGDCTLRAAIMEANALGGSHTITIPANYSIVLTLGATNDNNADSGDLDIFANIEIIGAAGGQQPRIRNLIADRIFHLATAGISLSLTNLMLHYSGGPTVSGGAVAVTGGQFRADRLSIYSNVGFIGGGIVIAGAQFEIYNTTIAYNTGYGNGGGINIQNTTGTIVNSTIVGNQTPLVNGTSFPGGGLFTFAPTAVDVIHTTITQNYTALYGGGFSVYNPSTPTAQVTFSNSIISGNGSSYQAPDCYLFPSVQPKAAYAEMNILGVVDQWCNTVPGPSLMIGPTQFGALTNINHPYVIPVTPGSAAINAAPSCLPVLGGFDQMGNVRPAGSGCDLGAYEHPAGNDGTLLVAPPAGVPLSAIDIEVGDQDLVNAGTLEVQVITQNTLSPDSETVTLTETGPGSGVFTVNVTLSPSPATPGNGLIEAGLGHTVVVSYWDAVTANADAATLTALYTVIPPVAANLLANGDFEAGSTGWTISGPSGDKVNGKNPFDGVQSLRFKGFAGKLNSKVSQTVLAPPIVDQDTVTLSAQIESGASASGKMKLTLKTDQNRQIKADVKFDLSGAYGLHEIILPITLLAGRDGHRGQCDVHGQVAEREGICRRSQSDGHGPERAAHRDTCRHPAAAGGSGRLPRAELTAYSQGGTGSSGPARLLVHALRTPLKRHTLVSMD
ncbi:MAG: hypothetical protein IPM16_16825 [Chloroflexi bacterium]|nr:hypothetical protein [Chloroflexota bacterium]